MWRRKGIKGNMKRSRKRKGSGSYAVSYTHLDVYKRQAYNQMLDYLEAQVKNGQAFVIRPKKASGVGRIEKDKEKLLSLIHI